MKNITVTHSGRNISISTLTSNKMCLTSFTQAYVNGVFESNSCLHREPAITHK